MAIEIKNGASINFGTFGAARSITAVRARRASDDGQPVVKRLAAAVAVAATEQFAFDEGALKFKYPKGDLTDVHMAEALESYWGINNGRTAASTSMEIDLMTGASGSEAAVNVSGYSQQTLSDWDVATVAD